MTENNQYWNQLISNGVRYLQEQNNDAAAAVLKKADFDVEHTYHDSWRWGTDYWALVLSLNERDYEALGDNRDQVERDIMSALVTFQKKSRDLLSTVTIRPAPEQSIEQSIGRSIDRKKELPVQKAAKDTEQLMREGRYDLAFDCIYSAYSDYLRRLFAKQDKSYEADDRTGIILKSAGKIIDTINEVRHNNTAAHSDGQMLEKREAQLAISLTSLIVNYVEDAEASHKIETGSGNGFHDSGEKETDEKVIVGYEYSVTGGSGYAFADGEEVILEVSGLVMPSFPVYIRGEGINWTDSYPFDSEKTIDPGIKYVYDAETGIVTGKVLHCGRGKYILTDNVTAQIDNDGYTFRRGDGLIAGIRRCSRDAYPVPASFDKYYDWEPYFKVSVYQKIDPKLLAMICAFPMLQSEV